MGRAQRRGRRIRRRAALPLAAVGGVVALASAAWACVPIVSPPDPGSAPTYFQNCTAPPGATYRCKPVPGWPKFPAATFIQGPPGSTLVAFTPRGLIRGMKYDLQFVGKPDRKRGVPCHGLAALVIGGPVVADEDGAVAPTPGTIPVDAPLGGGDVCFSDVSYDTDALAGRDPSDVTAQNHSSAPARFKVII